MKDSIWLADPEEHDFPAAEDYLDLLFPAEQVTDMSTVCNGKRRYSKKLKTFEGPVSFPFQFGKAARR